MTIRHPGEGLGHRPPLCSDPAPVRQVQGGQDVEQHGGLLEPWVMTSAPGFAN
ncbi:MAG TPA: hypothetical protein VK813_11330 [Edaphobacter sp.]|nr:hypothetical protein [Edaphobacter sp.]